MSVFNRQITICAWFYKYMRNNLKAWNGNFTHFIRNCKK